MRSLSLLWSVLGAAQVLAGPLEVQVIDSRLGEPVVGIEVAIGGPSTKTNAEGKATFDEASVGDTLEIDDREYLRLEKTLTASNLKGLLRVRLTANRDFSKDLALHGTAIGEDGQPLSGRVHVKCGVTERDTLIDAEGQFAVERLAPGRCWLSFQADGSWRDINDVQYFTLSRKTRAIQLGHRIGSAAVTVFVAGADEQTEVFVVAGDASREPRSCRFYNDDTSGAGILWGDPGFACKKQSGRYTCPTLPSGAYTVIARTMVHRSTTLWLFNQWSKRIAAGVKPVVVNMPVFANPSFVLQPDAGSTTVGTVFSNCEGP